MTGYKHALSLYTHVLLLNYLTQYTIDMADPSGAAPQPGPDDVSTAILRPKKSYVSVTECYIL